MDSGNLWRVSRRSEMAAHFALAFSHAHKYKPRMLSRWCFRVFILLWLSSPSLSQQPATAPTTKSDYSQEAAIVEDMTTKLAFQDSGSFTRQQTSTVRILSDTGVKDWGLLSLPYQSATQTVEIDYVRVRKPDGSIVLTPSDNVQDLDSEITRAAPFYSDLREKHIAVKGLGKGDTLEYAVHWQSTKPLIPGQFWFEYNFHRDGIVLSERLEIQVPADRAVKVKGTKTQTVSTQGPLRIYTWTYSKLQNTTDAGEEEKKAVDRARGRVSPPDVQISTFQTWTDVGRWYWDLQKERVEPSPAVRAKAAELTKGLTDDEAKLRSIYSFVSTQYRYIGIAFGVGRYQPHAADDVLSNNYGDCKDKHTLLASLLEAAGLTIYPALISSSRILDEDVPSPAQFDHLIGYLPHGKDGIWIDTTPEVTALGFLLPVLQDKKVLVISGDHTAKMLSTPIDPPFPGSQNFTIEGKLQEDGTFQAKVEDRIRGENEVYLRTAFRQVPQSQWKDLVQQISYQLGYAGTVSDVSASAPEAVNEPFRFAYSYNRKDYPEWSNHRFTVPGLPFAMPPVRDDSKYPVWLGSALETISTSKVGLPADYVARVPANVDLKYDFAEYQATYSQEKGVLTATRRLIIKQHEVPVTEFSHYRQFLKDMSDDVNQYVPALSSSTQASPFIGGASGPTNSPRASGSTAASPAAALQERLLSLPNSDSPEAGKLEEASREQIARHDLPGAVSSLYRAVAADGKFARAWVLLGTMLLAQKQTEAGVEAFHHAMVAAPGESAVPKALGFELMGNADFDAAVPVWQDFIKAHPDDPDGPNGLGTCLRRLNRNTEAAAAYEASLKIKSNQPAVQMSLGTMYLQAGDRQKASAAFQRLAEIDSERRYLNDAAYQMANSDLDLSTALSFAKQAVSAAEEDSDKIKLPELTVDDLGKIFRLAAYWDTLGWTYERTSNMVAAEEYLRASWKLNQDGVVAGHLCHMYRREHRTALAIQLCKMAISRMSMSKQVSSTNQFSTELAAANENLNFLTGRPVHSTNSFDTSDATIAQRTYKLPRFLSGTESAEFFVLFASDGKSKKFKVEDVKFISGSDKMKGKENQLNQVDFNVPAPGESRTRFVWRGILGCYQYTGCSFVVLDPSSVHSLN